jgi:hypothetical protein
VTAFQAEISTMASSELRQLRLLNKQVYTLEELFAWIRTRKADNLVVKDPATNIKLSNEVTTNILLQYRKYVNRNATWDPPPMIFDEQDVELIMTPVSGFLPGFFSVFDFYHVCVDIHSLSRRLDFGFIPEYTDQRDTSNTSAVLCALLRQLWDNRRFLNAHHPVEAIAFPMVHLCKLPEY